MKTFKYILFLLLIFSIGASIYIAVQPNEFNITRTRTVAAPSEVIYKHITDFKNWESWSPWIHMDPETKITLLDSSASEVTALGWENANGTGFLKTIESLPFQSINQELQLDNLAPIQVQWALTQNSATETELSWTLAVTNLSFYEKGLALIDGGFEKIYAPYLERGLENLDTQIIATMAVYSIQVDGIAQHGGGFYIYSSTSSKITDIQTTISKVMPAVKSYAIKNNIAMAGAPFIIYHTWDEANNAVMFSCSIPTTTQITTTESDILTGQLAPFKAIKTTLKGHTKNLKEAWDANRNYINQYNMQATETGPMLEVYLTEPTTKPNPANWITEIYTAIN